jgi:hypothetical protein
LLSDLDNLVRFLGARNVETDVAVEGGLTGYFGRALEKWLAPSAPEGALDLAHPTAAISTFDVTDPQSSLDLRLNLWTLSTVPGLRPVALRAPVAVCALRSESSLRDPLRTRLVSFLDDRPIVVIVAPWQEAWTMELKSLAEEKAWLVERLDTGQLPQNFPERLRSRPWPDLMTLCRAQIGILSVGAAERVLNAVLAEEARGLRVRQAMVQQRVAIVQRSSVPNPNELVGQLRAKVQRHFADFERGIADRLSRLVSPGDSRLWSDLAGAVSELDHLEWSDDTSTKVQIPGTFEESITNLMAAALRREADSNIVALHDLMDALIGEINQVLGAAGIGAMDLGYNEFSPDPVNRLIGRTRVDRPYRGDLPRPGIDEYVNVVRRNAVVLSLLSFLGLSSLLGRISGSMRLAVLAAVIPVAVFLLRRSVEKARRESRRREIDRAREVLQVELRRLLSEIERTWPAVFADYLREHFSTWGSEIDLHVRDQARRAGEAVAEEKIRVQRQLQTLETTSRQLQVATKRREVIAVNAARLREEIRQVFETIAKQMELSS